MCWAPSPVAVIKTLRQKQLVSPRVYLAHITVWASHREQSRTEGSECIHAMVQLGSSPFTLPRIPAQGMVPPTVKMGCPVSVNAI